MSKIVEYGMLSKHQRNVSDAVLDSVTGSKKSILVSAVAGSGKTTTMLATVRRLAQEGVSLKNTIITCFNNDAAQSMKKGFETYCPKSPIGHIGTFDSFTRHIVDNFVPKRFNPKDRGPSEATLIVLEQIEAGNQKVIDYLSSVDIFFFDEVQDTDDYQARLTEIIREHGAVIVAIGDESQCINEFRGAKPEYMKKFKESGYDFYSLPENRRSDKHLIEFFKAILENDPGQLEGKETMRANDGAEEGELPLVIGFPEKGQEEMYVELEVNKLLESGVHPSEILVLRPTQYIFDKADEEIFTTYDDEHDKVRIMTIHTSKGLEATYVFVMGMNHEFPRFPNEQEIQRQRRTFYVGATRCKKYLTMTYSVEKFNLKRSRYFEEISEDLFRAQNNGGREENNRTPSPFPWVGREYRPRYAVTDLAKDVTSAMLRKFREKGGILDLRWEKKSKLSHDSVGWKPNIKKRIMSQYGEGVELYIRYRGFGMTHEEAIEKVESYKGKRKARVKGYNKHIRRAKNFIARLKNEKFWCHDNGGEGAFRKTEANAMLYKYSKEAKNERVLYSEYRFEYLGYKEQVALKAFPDFYLVGTKEIVDIKFRTAEMTAEYTIQLLLYVCALRAIGLPVERISLYNVKTGTYYTASVKNWHHEHALASALVGESIRKKMEGWEHLLENYFPEGQ